MKHVDRVYALEFAMELIAEEMASYNEGEASSARDEHDRSELNLVYQKLNEILEEAEDQAPEDQE